MKRSTKRKLATIATFLVLALLFCERVTGVHAHMILGLLLIIALGYHTWNRKNRILKCPICLRVVDIVTTIAMLGVLISGVLLKPFRDIIAVLIIHKLCSVIMVIGIVVHIFQHRAKTGRKK